ncbi:MAG TPA: nicotinate (nicotinamide) nucleotide adenylyltransferase [Ginsengibacter sp.]
MNIGLYFGSFNPIHVGHLIIASHVVNNSELDQIWFIISPQNPLKKEGSLLNEHHRKHLIDLSIEGEKKLRTSDIEFKLPKPSYTIDTMTYLSEKYPKHTFSIIMGSDSFTNIKRWKNYEALLNNYEIYIYERPGFRVKEMIGAKLTMLQAPLLEISSTRIRELIHSKKSIKFLVPDVVKEEIEKHQYYG